MNRRCNMSYPESVPYGYKGIKEEDGGELCCVFKAQDPMPAGFAHLEEISVPKDDLASLPENFDAEPAKKAIEEYSVAVLDNE